MTHTVLVTFGCYEPGCATMRELGWHHRTSIRPATSPGYARHGYGGRLPSGDTGASGTRNESGRHRARICGER